MAKQDLESVYRQFANPEALRQHLGDQIDEFERILNDDQQFCDKEIQATRDYLQQIEEKLRKKIDYYRGRLNQLEETNQETYKRSTDQFDKEIGIVNEAFSSGQHFEAFKKLHDYEQRFQNREKVMRQIPKFNITDEDINQLFIAEKKTTAPPVIVAPTTVISPNNHNHSDDDDNDTQLSAKESRRQKVIEKMRVEREDKDIQEDDQAKTDPNIDLSGFGIRSVRPTNSPQNNPTSPTTGVQKKPFSTRLASLQKTSLPFSGRNISPSSSARDSPQQKSPISIPSPIVTPRSMNLDSAHLRRGIKIISHYEYRRQMFLLMACNPRYLLIFEIQNNRQDRWQLGLIERASQNQHHVNWHKGLIMSMGYIDANRTYLFTQREVFIYDVLKDRIVDSRTLPSGNDEEYESTLHPYENAHRGIGTYFGGFIYHLYSNRTVHWILSKTELERKSHVVDFSLSQKIPDVQRVLHVNVNNETMNFLVQCTDHSYAVVFCSLKDCTPLSSTPPVKLTNAKSPLRLYSAYIRSMDRYAFFVNDPSAGILHILDSTAYLDSFRIMAHAIYYEPDKQELIIVTDNSICSMNFNEEDFFS